MDTGSTPLIGIVDHDRASLRSFDEVLTARGFRTLLLVEGSNPYQTILQERPDLVILADAETIPENEWLLLHLLRLDQATAQTPLLICSRDPQENSQRSEDLTRYGPVSRLDMPFDPDVLTATIREMLGSG